MSAPGLTLDASASQPRARVHQALAALAAEARAQGMPPLPLEGQLIRPLTAYAVAAALRAEGERFWRGALAVQLAHEASLVHDDVIDEAATRRGRPTAFAAGGVGKALVLGDHLLTWAYRQAARTGSLEFADRFAVAVERTVAGEVEQGRKNGERLGWDGYERIALDKAGALLGCAASVAPSVAGRDDAGDFYELGRRLGLLYQMLDDLLDYCPGAGAGKPALGDYAQRRWTWVLDELPDPAFGRDPAEVAAALHHPDRGATPMRRCLERLEHEFSRFECRRAALLPGDAVLAPLVADWRARALAAVAREERAASAARGPIMERRETSPIVQCPPSSVTGEVRCGSEGAAVDAEIPVAFLQAGAVPPSLAAEEGPLGEAGLAPTGLSPIAPCPSSPVARSAEVPPPKLGEGQTASAVRERALLGGDEARSSRVDHPSSPAVPSISRRIRERVPAPGAWAGYLGANSRSFAFAARFFPRAEGEKVARVYAYCRVTDDLVDRPDGETADALDAVLDEWVALSRRAYDGGATGIELLERAMGEMAAAGVPFTHAAELAEGMRMDLRGERYASLDALRVYTHRVASVVGLWLTELFGVHDAPTLRRAAALGHAMQLTNILRDVGEDARGGRLYLPADRMRHHGVTTDDLDAMRAGRLPVTPGYRALLEELMRAAEDDYRLAFAAIPRLPGFFQRPVAVAAHVYRGIHGALRRQGYDNLRRRAYTSPGEKAVLAARALWELRGARRRMESHDAAAADPVLLPERAGPVPAGGA